MRVGKNTDVLRNKDVAGHYPDECAFSIIYSDSYDTMDLIANTPDEVNIWVTGLTCLISGKNSEYSVLIDFRLISFFFFSKNNFSGDISLFVGPLIPLFWTSGDVCPGFKAWVDQSLPSLSTACNGLLRFTSDATPADFAFWACITRYQYVLSLVVSSSFLGVELSFLFIHVPSLSPSLIFRSCDLLLT